MNATALHTPVNGKADQNLLVIDTDPGVRWTLERGLAHSGYHVKMAYTVAEAIRTIEQERTPLVLMELLPEAGFTLETLSLLTHVGKSSLIVCTSTDVSPKTVIECIRRGAWGFLPKPFSLASVRGELANALQARDKNARPAAAGTATHRADASLLVGESPAMQELRAMLREVARTDLNCLIRGESGAGKDVVAREIHRLSRRSEYPFVKVNCSALPEPLLESEMFGYEKGAFTGANEAKPGRFGLANKGIIFLDEIGELHPNLQAKLLQVIEHKEFSRLGGRSSTKVDVQIIAATNSNIEEKVKTGAFRHDLLFRLNEVCIWAPPLSKRKEDIPLLVHHFVQKHARHTAGTPIQINEQDLAALCDREWPGNVRELESTIKRWIALGKKEWTSFSSEAEANAAPARSLPLVRGEKTEAPEDSSEGPSAEQMLNALEECQWNRRKAAQMLGISYQILRRRILKYGLDKRP